MGRSKPHTGTVGFRPKDKEDEEKKNGQIEGKNNENKPEKPEPEQESV